MKRQGSPAGRRTIATFLRRQSIHGAMSRAPGCRGADRPASGTYSQATMKSAPALFAIATLIWGSTWLGITFQLGVVSPEVSVAYRFALAALLLAAWCRW